MAVVNKTSTLITNRDATPKVLTDATISGGDVRSTEGYVTTNNGDSATSTYRLCTVPSNARVDTVKYQCGILGTSCTINVGVYYPTFIPVGAGSLTAALAGTSINTTFFASGIASATAVALTEITNQSTTNTIALQELPLWQAVGLSADPGISLDIVANVAVATAAAGLVGVKVQYVL